MGWFTPPLPVGTPAPDFSVPDQDGSRVTLSALRGKNVVLVFYPADDTSVCTQAIVRISRSLGGCQAKNTVVFGVNPARSAAHQKFRDKYKFPFPLADRRRPEDREAVSGRRLVRAPSARCT